jgi:serine/threonine protein kinase
VRVDAGTVRYELRERLGHGAFGDVYEARDRHNGAIVAIKRLRGLDPGWVFRFKREYRVVADLSHPNIARLYELFCEKEQWYLTMELVRGRHFGEHVSRAPEDLRSCFIQLALAIEALHRSGCLHRDIKPPNALVEPTGRVVLLDFGLACDRQGRGATATAGTPPYMAPELGMGGVPTEASDWYAFGVMLYEALAGTIPFEGTESEIFRKKLSGPPARSELRRGGNDAELEQLALDLLSPVSSKRPTGEQILGRLEATDREHSGRSSAESGELPVVGRERETQQLSEALARARQGAVLATVHGEPGVGRSTLVRTFAATCAGAGARFYSGCCRESESLPFKGLDGVIDELCTDLLSLPDEKVAAVAPSGIVALVQMFPVLKRVRAFARSSRRDTGPRAPHAARRAARAALRDLLSRLSARDPVVLFVDDLQWANEDSVSVLLDLLAPPAPPILVVVAYRRDGRGKGGPLDRFLMSMTDRPGVTRVDIPVDPLDRDGVEQLLSARPDGVVDAERAMRETGGHPYLLTRLLGAGDWGPGDPTDLAGVIAAQIAGLGPEARQLLEIIALSTRALSQAAAFGVADALWNSIVVGELRREKLVQCADSTPDGLIEPYHVRVRESVLATMKPERLRELHLALATYLETRGRADPESLVYHYRLAGDSELALKWSRVAAVNARDAFAFARAAELLAEAVELAADDDDRIAVLGELAEAQVQAGQRAAAGRSYVMAAQVASVREQDEVEAAMRTRAGRHFLLAGHVDKGIGLLADALGAVGVTLPKDAATAVAATINVGAELATRRVKFSPRTEDAVDPEALRRLDLLLAVARALVMSDIRAAWAGAQALLEAVEAGEPRRVQRAIALAEELDDDLGRAWACFAVGVWRGTKTEFAPCLDQLQEARLRFLACGQAHVREAGTAHVLQVGVLAGMGIDIKGAYQQHARLVQDAVERDDRFVMNWARVMFTHLHLARGDVETARRNIEMVRAEWPAASEEFFAAMTIANDLAIAVYEDPISAWQIIEAARPTFESLYASLIPSTRSVLHRVRAVSALAVLLDGKATREQTVERISLSLETASEWDAGGPVHRTVEALMCAAKGDFADYERKLEATEEKWRERGQRGLVLTARLRIHQSRGETQQAAAVATELQTLGIADPDRFATVYVGSAIHRQVF